MQTSAQHDAVQAVRIKDRRLTKRIQGTWKVTESGFLPSWRDIQSLELGEDWDHCFGVDLRLSDGYPYFIFLGDALCHLSNLYLANDSRFEKCVLDIAASKMDDAALSRIPITYGDTLRLENGSTCPVSQRVVAACG